MQSTRRRIVWRSFWVWTGWVIFYAAVMDWQLSQINFAIALFSSASGNYSFALISAGVWYICRHLPADRFPLILFAMLHFVMGNAVSAFWLFINYGGLYLLLGKEGFAYIPLRSFIGWQYLFGIIQYFLVTGIFYTVIYYRNYKEKQLAEAELKLLNRDTQLRALKLQMNPHFLFNTLNSISALVTEDPRLARKMISRLSELLRMSLEHHEEQMVPLETELAFVRTYVSIEQIRFGSRMQFAEKIGDDISPVQPIPAMILQPLVENAIKHGIANSIEGGTITLHLSKRDHTLECEIINPLPASWDQQVVVSTGTGLENIRQRLKLLYGENYSFETELVDQKQFIVRMAIPERS